MIGLLVKSRVAQLVVVVLLAVGLLGWYVSSQVNQALNEVHESIDSQAIKAVEEDKTNVQEAEQVVVNQSDAELDRGLCGGSDCPETDLSSGLDSTSTEERRLSASAEVDEGVQGGAYSQQDQSGQLYENMREPEPELITCSLDELDELNAAEPEHSYECDGGYWVRYERHPLSY